MESSSGGVGKHVIDLSLRLLKQGHEVDVVYSLARSDDMFREGIIRVAEAGGNCYHIEIASGVSLVDCLPILKLRRLIQSRRYRVIHGQSSKAGLVARLAAWGLHRKVVYTPHLMRTASPGLGRIGFQFFAISERILAKITDKIICVSKFEEEHALKIGLPSGKLIYCPIGHDLPHLRSRDAVRKEWEIAENELVFGFVGRLTPQKDPQNLLRSFAQANLPSDSHLVIIGGGELESNCIMLVDELSISKRVLFLGHVDSTPFISGFDVFVISSESESFPRVMLEAGQAHLPLISTQVGDVPFLITDGESGFLVPIGDSKAMAFKMEQLASDSGLRKSLGEGLFVVSQQFTEDAMTEAIVGLYSRLLSDVR